jgi:hypothetical protein
MDIDPFKVRDYLRDWRYGFTLVCFFILGLLLIFYNNLPIGFREIFIPSLAVYTIGNGLIGSLHIALTVFDNTKALRKDKVEPSGIKNWKLNIIIFAYIIWLILFIVYNFCYLKN